jgi:hypothetical protein
MTVTLSRDQCTNLIIAVREIMKAIQEVDPNGPRHPLAPLHQEFGVILDILLASKYQNGDSAVPLTPAQVAHRLGVTGDRVRQLFAAGKLECTVTPLGRLVDPAALQRYIDSRQKGN